MGIIDILKLHRNKKEQIVDNDDFVAKKMREETIFVFNGHKFDFELDGIDVWYGDTHIRFRIVASSKIAHKMIMARLFKAELPNANVKMECYCTRVNVISAIKNQIEIGLVGTVID